MSTLDQFTKEELAKHVRAGQRLIEMFPGGDPDSLLYFQSLGLDARAFGDDECFDPHGGCDPSLYTCVRVPPYPDFGKVDHLFLEDPCWLLIAEKCWNPQDAYKQRPDQGLRFIDSSLRSGGSFLLSGTHNIEARILHKWLGQESSYDFYITCNPSYNNVAVFTKR